MSTNMRLANRKYKSNFTLPTSFLPQAGQLSSERLLSLSGKQQSMLERLCRPSPWFPIGLHSASTHTGYLELVWSRQRGQLGIFLRPARLCKFWGEHQTEIFFLQKKSGVMLVPQPFSALSKWKHMTKESLCPLDSYAEILHCEIKY